MTKCLVVWHIDKKYVRGCKMENIDVILGTDHLEDIASAKPIPALKEVIWNAFDSKSLIVKVDFLRNPMTDTIEK